MSNTINVLDADQQQDVLSEPVYVQVPLEDGRVMMLPAQRLQQQPIHLQRIHQQNQQHQNQPQQIHQVQQQHTQQQQQQHSQQQQQQQVQINQMSTLGERIERGTIQRGDLGSLVQSLTEQDFVFQTQSTQNVQYLKEWKGDGSETVKTTDHTVPECAMKCGSTGNSKGSERLVTDSRCGHTICLKCIMKQPSSCPICQKEHLLDRHMVVSKMPGSCVCKVCEKSFHRAGDLIRHERICHGINTGEFACSHCSKSFVRSFDLRRHMRTHNGEKQYSCSVCGKGFNRGENLRRHMNVHTGVRPYNCEYCDRNFTQHENLKRHLLTHTGEYQKYKCSTCKKEFTRLASLKRHEHRHTGLWPYTCTECNKGFSEPGLYQKHRLVHQGIKPYICTTCNKGFNNPKAARNHRRIHTGERPYKCQICEQQFSQWGNLKRHKQVHLKDGKSKIRSNGRKFGRKKKDPLRPKLPMTPYFSWFMESRNSLHQSHPELKMTELARVAGQVWKELDDTTREYYEKKAGEEKEKYREAMKVYNTHLKSSLDEECKMIDVGSLTDEHGAKVLASDKTAGKDVNPAASFTVETSNTITFKSCKTYQFSPASNQVGNHSNQASNHGNQAGNHSNQAGNHNNQVGSQVSIQVSNPSSSHSSNSNNGSQSSSRTSTQVGSQSSNHGNQSSNHGNQSGNQSGNHGNQSSNQSSNHGNQSDNHGNQSGNHGNQASNSTPNKEFSSSSQSSPYDALSVFIEPDGRSEEKGNLLESASRSAGLHPDVLQGSIIREDNPSFNLFRRNNYNDNTTNNNYNNNNNNNNNYNYTTSANTYNQYSFTVSNSPLLDLTPSVDQIQSNEEIPSALPTLYDPTSLETSFQTQEQRGTEKGKIFKV